MQDNADDTQILSSRLSQQPLLNKHDKLSDIRLCLAKSRLIDEAQYVYRRKQKLGIVKAQTAAAGDTCVLHVLHPERCRAPRQGPYGEGATPDDPSRSTRFTRPHFKHAVSTLTLFGNDAVRHACGGRWPFPFDRVDDGGYIGLPRDRESPVEIDATGSAPTEALSADGLSLHLRRQQ
ncbi:hypothetical protein MRX96_030029 [Rhipicephalus microplus]